MHWARLGERERETRQVEGSGNLHLCTHIAWQLRTPTNRGISTRTHARTHTHYHATKQTSSSTWCVVLPKPRLKSATRNGRKLSRKKEVNAAMQRRR